MAVLGLITPPSLPAWSGGRAATNGHEPMLSFLRRRKANPPNVRRLEVACHRCGNAIEAEERTVEARSIVGEPLPAIFQTRHALPRLTTFGGNAFATRRLRDHRGR